MDLLQIMCISNTLHCISIINEKQQIALEDEHFQWRVGVNMCIFIKYIEKLHSHSKNFLYINSLLLRLYCLHTISTFELPIESFGVLLVFTNCAKTIENPGIRLLPHVSQ